MEMVVLVGLQASGKSSYYRARFANTHALISKDLFPNAHRRDQRQQRELVAALQQGRSVVVDNTNPTRADRAALIETAHRLSARVVVCWFPVDRAGSIRRNAERQGHARIPVPGILATARRLEHPSWDEGFDALRVVSIGGDGQFLERDVPPGAPLPASSTP